MNFVFFPVRYKSLNVLIGYVPGGSTACNLFYDWYTISVFHFMVVMNNNLPN